MSSDLPRLLYLADVPVEPTFAGAILVFRLLQNYPSDNLLVINVNKPPSPAERRLPGVIYREMPIGFPRLQHTRWVSTYSAFAAWHSGSRGVSRRVEALLGSFAPQAVLSVTHGHTWLAASRFARTHNIPLHLILHDEWELAHFHSAIVKNWAHRIFGATYRQAASRFCVSPFMEELYRSRHIVAGSVLYPARGSDALSFDTPPARISEINRPLVFGYAGSINSPGYASLLKNLADCLSQSNASLKIFGPLSQEQGTAAGLTSPNIQWCGMVSSNELIKRLHEEVDVLFLPMSFDAIDRSYMEINFPSKLADYTAAGLPLLIQAPAYASAARWTVDNPGVAELVTTPEPSVLASVVQRLSSPAHRLALGKSAIVMGDKFFSARRADEIFLGNVISAHASSA